MRDYYLNLFQILKSLAATPQSGGVSCVYTDSTIHFDESDVRSGEEQLAIPRFT